MSEILEQRADELVTMYVANQYVGIPVHTVRDILGPQKLTRIPLAAPEIAGVLNLRGRVVTSVDLRRRLNIPDQSSKPETGVSVVIEHDNELYSLMIDEIGEVFAPPHSRFVRDVVALSPEWREVATGIYRMKEQLLILLEVGRILSFKSARHTNFESP